MDTATIARWSFIIGLVVALIIALVPDINEAAFWLLVIAGLVAGWTFFTEREAEHHFLLIAVGLAIFSQTPALADLPSLGETLTALLVSVSTFFGVMVVALVVRNIVDWVRVS
ncbi:MAG: hypothetical protein ACRDFQ_07860 [Anaerolineales bacterium]